MWLFFLGRLVDVGSGDFMCLLRLEGVMLLGEIE